MPADLSDLTGALLDAAVAAGAEAADALAIDATSVSIDALGGRLEHAERAEGVEVGLRVLIDHRQACVAASDTRPETFAEMAERAVAMAREAPRDPTIGLAEPGELSAVRDAGALDLVDPAPEPAPAELEDEALRGEAAALAVAGVSKVQSASAAYGRRRIALAATNGFAGGYDRTDRSRSVVAITGDGTAMERDWYGDTRIYGADLLSPEEIGRLAGERTAARAGARKPPTGRFPVIFEERIAASLLGHLLQAVSGTAVARGSTWLRDAMGEAVLPTGLSVVEEPLRPRAAGSRPFDAEGLPTRERHIVENGILKGWTLDLGTARKLGLRSSGNAARGPSSPPAPTVTNVRVTQSERSLDDLVGSIGSGLLVTSLIGSTINPTTGDYSRGASGVWIENGAPTYPVNECTIAGNLREMLRSVVPANDARPHLSRVVPSLLVEGLTIAGA
ncbi:MAG: TldD/PmbA family protein [Paracoccaceae bacterium]|nr:TldD/PmbA family protein [Paracoccaceae bacterium]